MSDSDEPRKPRRPVMKPSVWSTRPIPQAAPERRTADARTPKLKELAARAHHRASLAALAAPTVAPPAPKATTPAECAKAWAQVGAQTQRVLRAGGGDSTPAQKLTRNRAISAAYADLARGDDRMRWAGLASVVSTQAHCAMQDAGTAVGRADTAREVAPGVAESAAAAVPLVGPLLAPVARREATAAAGEVAGMAHEVQGALYDTNREIFSDIYPTVAMYKQHGLAGIEPRSQGGCGDNRPDRKVAPALQSALRQIDRGDVVGGSHALADYEQKVIVQQRIYDDPRRPLLKSAMQMNQAVSDVPVMSQAANLLMKARKPEVAISAECGQGTPVPFPGDINVAQNRVDYYDRLVAAYLKRDQGARDAMGRVIAARDPLRGGSDYAETPLFGLPLRGP